MATRNTNAGAAAALSTTTNETAATAGGYGSLPEALEITAKRESYYAGGQPTPFGFEPRVVPLTAFTEAQYLDLIADPYVIVRPADLPADPADGSTANS